MNDYILLYVSGETPLKYKTPFKGWKPVNQKIGTVRLTLLGSLDAAYASGGIKQWTGRLRTQHNPPAGYGSPEQLLATINHKGPLVFVDHDGVEHAVHSTGQNLESSMTTDWTGDGNKIDYTVFLTEAI